MSHPLGRMLAPALMLVLGLLALAAGPAQAAPPDPSPLLAQPAAQDFGLVPVDQGEQSTNVWIQNAGSVDVQLSAATLDGDSAFRVTSDGCAGQLLAAGQGCNLGVGFDPAAGDAYAATLHVPTSGFADLDVALRGVGGVEQVTLDPPALDFAALAAGDSAVRTLRLTNSGSLPFQFIVAIPSGGDVGAFHVEHDGCSLQQLATGAACDMAVRFAPSAAGAYAATLLLVGGSSQPVVVQMHGSGVAAPAAPAAAPTEAAPTAESRTAAAVDPPFAQIVLDAAGGLPVPIARGRIQLGAAHCVEVARCSVVVRARVYAVAAGTARFRGRGRGVTSARTDVVLWRLRSAGGRVRLTLPAGLRGTPAVLVATLRVHADGRQTGVRTLVVPLAAG